MAIFNPGHHTSVRKDLIKDASWLSVGVTGASLAEREATTSGLMSDCDMRSCTICFNLVVSWLLTDSTDAEDV
jgi:hypothetical protein